MDLNRAAIDRFYDGIGVLLGEISRQMYIDRDPIDPLGVRISFTPHGEREIVGGDVPVLAEREDINARTRRDRGHKKIERGRS